MFTIGENVLENDIYKFKGSKHKRGEKGLFANKKIKENNKIGLAFTQIKSADKLKRSDFERTILGAFVRNSNHSNIDILQDGKDYFFISKIDIKKNDELLIDFKEYPWEK